MPPPRLLPQLGPAMPPATDLADDMLYGVGEIAAFLGLTPRLDVKKAEQRVYQLRRRGKAPIFKLEGVGLAARRSALRAYVERQERAVLDRTNGSG